jgi:hypothetical protein
VARFRYFLADAAKNSFAIRLDDPQSLPYALAETGQFSTVPKIRKGTR